MPSTTTVASVHLTGATVAGSVNVTEFLAKAYTFLLLLSRKMDLAISQ